MLESSPCLEATGTQTERGPWVIWGAGKSGSKWSAPTNGNCTRPKGKVHLGRITRDPACKTREEAVLLLCSCQVHPEEYAELCVAPFLK